MKKAYSVTLDKEKVDQVRAKPEISLSGLLNRLLQKYLEEPIMEYQDAVIKQLNLLPAESCKRIESQKDHYITTQYIRRFSNGFPELVEVVDYEKLSALIMQEAEAGGIIAVTGEPGLGMTYKALKVEEEKP